LPELPNTGSPAYFELLREWLRVCDKEHEEYGCHSEFDSVLPTRVLDLGDGMNSNSLRLYCSKKDERGDYIALSTCWVILRLNKVRIFVHFVITSMLGLKESISINYYISQTELLFSLVLF
jgi:hypothetical protein